ncbi:MAG TPA: hypothetical protein VFV67_04945 [Actinophytocola sp.]|uniref:hypothetical protein n=1 Tax=Actinophytocola sp. TaxID=1872138 RepID=UPI002DB74498|nr:hypothetical protein [Actinophytocola sp.]HEU5469978.1 hypothetical protein [Actinophytocola sp.]
MSAMRRRPAMLIAVLATLGMLTAACGSEPREANSAIITDDRVVSVDDVQARLNRSLETEPAAKELAKTHKLDLVSRGIVTQVVRHELIAEAARQENLTVSEREVDDFLGRVTPSEDPVQKSIEAAFDRRDVARDRLLTQKFGAKYLDRLQVTWDGATVVSQTNAKSTAVELAERMAAVAPEQMAEVLQGSASQEVNPSLNQEFNPVNTYQIYAQYQGQVVLSPLFSVEAGNVVAFPFAAGEQAGTGWLVAYIKDRSENATLPEDQAAAVSEVDPVWAESIGTQLLTPLAGELGLRLSPRYGVWDELAVAVAPSEAEKIGVVLPVAGKTTP